MSFSQLLVIEPGALTTIQDAGRPGHAHLGVPPSGALHRRSYELANRLVGNLAGAAVLETTLTGPTLELHFAHPHAVALTGAPAPMWVDGRPVALYATVFMRPGQQLRIGACTGGLRSYLAISGGIVAETALGSVSTDLLTGLGPLPLHGGMLLEVGIPRPAPAVDVAGFGESPAHPVLHCLLGPRADWLTDDSLSALAKTTWSVSPDSNRIGLRLMGPSLAWNRTAELPSEGVLTGSVQVPPNGQPIIFLNDHPVTGGYPVVAVLTDEALGLAAQLRPGSSVTLRPR